MKLPRASAKIISACWG